MDVDGDGRLDIIAAGRPDAIQIYRQTESGEFEMLRRNRIRGLSVSRDGMIVEDLIGTDGPLELVALTGGRIKIWPLQRNGRLAPPQELNAGDARIIAIFQARFRGASLRNVWNLGMVGVLHAAARERRGRANLRFEQSALSRGLRALGARVEAKHRRWAQRDLARAHLRRATLRRAMHNLRLSVRVCRMAVMFQANSF